MCPCPHCLVTFDQIPAIGTPEDEALRAQSRRVDTKERQDAVQKARNIIYEDGYVVNSTLVDNILKDQSLVPTVVSYML